jgi:hypothetical protein
MAQSKRPFGVGEPDIRKILDAGRIETELECERVMLAARHLMLRQEDQPDLLAIRGALRDLIVEFENRRWSDRTLITDAQIEESDAAAIQAEKEYAFIRQRRKMILSRLKESYFKQNDLALLLNHSKSYTSELLNGIRPFSSNDLILIHLLFKIPLKDLFITILSQETIVRLDTAIDKISASNPRAKSLRSALVDSTSEIDSKPERHDEKIKLGKAVSTKYPVGKLTLSNK